MNPKVETLIDLILKRLNNQKHNKIKIKRDDMSKFIYELINND